MGLVQYPQLFIAVGFAPRRREGQIVSVAEDDALNRVGRERWHKLPVSEAASTGEPFSGRSGCLRAPWGRSRLAGLAHADDQLGQPRPTRGVGGAALPSAGFTIGLLVVPCRPRLIARSIGVARWRGDLGRDADRTWLRAAAAGAAPLFQGSGVPMRLYDGRRGVAARRRLIADLTLRLTHRCFCCSPPRSW